MSLIDDMNGFLYSFEMAHSGRINRRDHNGDMAKQEDGLVYVWLWRSIRSQGLLLCYSMLGGKPHSFTLMCT